MHAVRLLLASSAALVLSLGCGGSPSEPRAASVSQPAPTAAPSQPQRERFETTLEKVGLDGSALDRSADPCSDFYQFACGNWVKKTEIPGDKPRWVKSFSVIDERNETDLKKILEESSKPDQKDPKIAQLGRYWSACMDESAVEKRGLGSIQPLLTKARALRDKKGVSALLSTLHQQQIWALFDVSAEQDFKDATRYLTYLDQNGLGLPDRDYYTKDDDKSKELRQKYQAHVERMFVLSGQPKAQAAKAAEDVLAIETELAKASKTRVERRNPQGLYNKLGVSELAQLSPEIDWKAYLGALGLGSALEVNVTSKPFFEATSRLLSSVPIARWRNYFAWHVLRVSAKTLPKAFVDESFELARALSGQKQQPVRWKRCIDATDEAMGELLAQPYVALRFAGESKAAAERLVAAIGRAFVDNLASLRWMDDTARSAARDKYQAMAFLIGYPDRFKSYDFEVTPGDYSGNAQRARAFELARRLSRIGKPVDRGEWEMTPPTVNAYYNPQKNQMVFPAGILQPPFYDVNAGVAVNLGAMGMVVGHELTHGFDDEGSQFDKAGNLKDWWDASVKQRFVSQTACVVDEYAKFEALPGVRLDGKLTLGENIADMGGVKLAFYAYRALTRDQKEAIADGFTEDQQFFLSLGQIWCSKQHEEYTRMAAQIDPHSPPRYRVNGPVRGLPEFAQAFACKPASPMNPPKRCSVW